MLNALLNKGGAGVSLSRPETVDHLNPLIRQHYVLNHHFQHLIGNLPDRDAAAKLEAFQKTARADIGKLAESIFSAGGVAYNGTDLEASEVDLGTDPEDMARRVLDLEREYQKMVAGESDSNHQIRTRAILLNVRTHSQERLRFLEDLEKFRPAKAS